MAKVRVVSDGMVGGTTVYVDDQPLNCVSKIEWEISGKTGYATAVLTVDQVVLDAGLDAALVQVATA